MRYVLSNTNIQLLVSVASANFVSVLYKNTNKL